MAALPDRACLTQGAAGHHPWEVVRFDSTSLGAAARWSPDPVAAVEGAEVVRGRRTGQAVHRDPLVHSVQVVDEVSGVCRHKGLGLR